MRTDDDGMPQETSGTAGESGLLQDAFAALAGLTTEGVLVGPGDDTAWLSARSGAVLATTDAMVLDHDWKDDWSTARDVGVKSVTQNLADLASMGGVGTGLLVTLATDPQRSRAWARELAEGIAEGAARAGVPVIGGDLSSAPAGVVMVSVTALGELAEGVEAPVLRSGAQLGDVVAVSGPLGRAGAGLELLLTDGAVVPDRPEAAEVVAHQVRPMIDLSQGPAAARAGATAMMDVSDGLVRDGDRIARASGVRLELDRGPLEALARRLEPAVGGRALRCVLAGGEEHELLATFPATATLPQGWIVLGRVVEGEPAVVLDGQVLDPRQGGWDHFGG